MIFRYLPIFIIYIQINIYTNKHICTIYNNNNDNDNNNNNNYNNKFQKYT